MAATKNVFEPRAKPVKLSARLSGTWGSSPSTKNSIVSIVVSTPFSPEVKDQCKIGINFSSADERQSTQMSSVHVRSATGYATEM